jgi:hypothetical protein
MKLFLARTLPIPEELAVLKGHDFSRAKKRPKRNAALATEGMRVVENTFSQGLKPHIYFAAIAARLKPCPFKTRL